MHLVITHGRQRDDGHIQGVTPFPFLDPHIPQGAEEEEAGEEEAGPKESIDVRAHGLRR